MASLGDTKRPVPWFWACWLSLAATFALFAAASFLPKERLWGANHLAFHTTAVRTGVLIVSGLFLVPPLASATWRAILWAARPYARGVQTGYNALALSGVASFVAFAAFRAATWLLGDGYYIINSFRDAASNQVGIGGYFDLVTVHQRIYPATGLLNYAASWTAARFGASPAGGVWILNCALGAAVVVAVLIALVRRTDWTEGTRLAVCALALFTGAIQLFFGYVEHYTPVLVVGAAYVWASFRVIQGTGRLWKPGVWLVAGVLFHVQALLLLPSYVWLLLWATACRRRAGRGVTLGVGAATAAAAVAAGFVPGIGRFYLPPLGPDSAYHALSATHLLDVANEVLLLCPVWLLYAVLVVRRRLASGTEPAHPPGAPAFAWMLALPAGLFLLLFRPDLGMARDWDLFCFTVFGLAAPGLLALIQYVTHLEDHAGRTAALQAPAVVLSAAMVFSWVAVNADTERAVARYRAILAYDQTHPGYAYETLARHFEDERQYARQVEALEMAYETSHNPRYLLKIARTLHDNNDTAGATKWYRRYLEARPGDIPARKNLLTLLAAQNRLDEMVSVSLAGIERSPYVPEFHFFLGNAYLAKGNKEDGLKAFAACSRLDPPPKLVRAMKRLLDQAGLEPPDVR